MMPMCPLCGCSETHLIKKIKSIDISKIYTHLFSIDISECYKEHETVDYYQCTDCQILFFYPAIMGNQLFYDNLQNFDWYYSENKSEFEFARQFIRAEDKVLEVGCGNGLFSKFIDVEKYVGLELNENAKLKASLDGHKVYVRTIEEHQKITSEKSDVVCSFQVLEHVGNPESFIRSCLDCLKIGGLLIISVPSEDSYLAIVEDGILNMPPHHVTRWPDSTINWIAKKYKLEIISLKHEPLADIHMHGYATEMIRSTIKRMFHVQHEIISTSVSHRFLTFICQILGTFYSMVLSKQSHRPVGHSVTMVLKKEMLS